MMLDNFDNCALLLPLNGVNNGVAFPDYSPQRLALQVAGGVKTVTAQSQYYGSAAVFDGSGSYLYCADQPALGFGMGDFGISLWVYPTFTGNVQALLDFRSDNTATPLALSIAGDGLARSYDGTVRTGGQLVNNAWNHVEWDRVSNVNTIYVNGEVGHTWEAAQDFYATRPLVIGAAQNRSSEMLAGYLQDIYIRREAALHYATFTPPGQLTNHISNNGSGVAAVTDSAGDPAAGRTVIAVPRVYGAQTAFHARTDENGRYAVQVPAVVHDVIILDDGVAYDDRYIGRVTPL